MRARGPRPADSGFDCWSQFIASCLAEIQREQKKAEKLIKDAAKRSDMTSARILAKEVVNMRRTVTKLAMQKATFLSLSNQMTEQLGA
jgi:charged multivesicular body protein 3